jgi:hypothetical protein
MKLIAELENNEKMTGIGFVNALVDTQWFGVRDLCEINSYLNTYCTARSLEPQIGLANVSKGGAE